MPHSGRLQDPLSLHKYLYVRGDPGQGVDLSGEFTSVVSMIGIGITATMLALISANVVNASAPGDTVTDNGADNLVRNGVLSVVMGPPLVWAGKIISPLITKLLPFRGPTAVVIPTRTGSVAVAGRRIGAATFVDPDPLADDVAATFAGGRYTIVKTTEELILYRAWHPGGAAEFGGFWSTLPPRGSLAAQIDFGLLPQWGNQATRRTAVSIPKGLVIYLGEVGSQGSLYVRGTPQVLVEGGVKEAWKIAGGTLK